MKRLWNWIRFGTVKEVVVDTINGIPCEINYVGRGGKIVGFWAYGHWCPYYPYQGEVK